MQRQHVYSHSRVERPFVLPEKLKPLSVEPKEGSLASSQALPLRNTTPRFSLRAKRCNENTPSNRDILRFRRTEAAVSTFSRGATVEFEV
jgi:hypothetical protein